MIGIYVPHIQTGYNLPNKVKNIPITISTHMTQIEWRPVVLLTKDLMVME